MEPIAEAGFRGVEVWAPHLLLASRSEWEATREKSQESDIPVVFLYAQLAIDASDRSRRQRDSLVEASGYFGVQGIKFTLSEGPTLEEQVSFLSEWARDLPRDVQLVRAFEGRTPQPGEIAICRKKLGARFRCSLNPFSLGIEKVGKLFENGDGDVIVNLGVRISSGGKQEGLRDAEEACNEIVSMMQQFDFKGSWTLESTTGMGTPGEDIEDLFDESEEDLNFLVTALTRR